MPCFQPAPHPAFNCRALTAVPHALHHRHEVYDTKADVWSWGVLLLECLTLQAPYAQTFHTPVQVRKHNWGVGGLGGRCMGSEQQEGMGEGSSCRIFSTPRSHHVQHQPLFGVLFQHAGGCGCGR